MGDLNRTVMGLPGVSNIHFGCHYGKGEKDFADITGMA